MSLFNSKEQEKNAKPQTASAPQVQPVHSAPVPPPAPSAESKPANTNGVSAKPTATPVTSSSTSGAYLDAGSKISGKLSFETPARIKRIQ
jgi:hypothetical protein